jgi:hypothetical protein
LKGKNLTPSISRLIVAHTIDILIFAEATAPEMAPEILPRILNPENQHAFYHSPDRCSRIKIYSRFASELLRPVTEDSHYTIRRLSLPNRPELHLAAAHLPSKRENSGQSQYDGVIPFCKDLRRVEERSGHRRTIVFGDLNMNQFEFGIISAMRFHAVSSKEIARQEQRTIGNKEYPFFYNPMWRFFGDRAEHPPGTYYYRKAIHECYFWNTFDQVLVRPALLDSWEDRNLQILTGDGEVSFLSRRSGAPDGNNRSDHLPVLFRLNL